ncbi:MAG TPA: Hpt domain-containing protein, partial [Gammaproteobacteria bacterium]|nr:Hpt domain-containing protein [Gammaproteobacteria bacterium]
LLYYVARASGNDERVRAIRELYRLAELMPGEEQIESIREGLAGPSVKLMRTVAQAIKEDLGAVKDALDIFVRTGLEDIEQLQPQLEMLKKIGDTLGVLGLEAARGSIQREAESLGGIIARREAATPGMLEKMAAALLDVEDDLDRELVRAVAPAGEAAAKSESEAQYRHVTQAVIGECIVNLSKVKEAVSQLIGSPGDGRGLDEVKPQLRGITAGLLMLNKTRAVKVVERIGRVIASRLGPTEKPLKPQHLERLADAIVSVEYYMETVSLGRNDPLYMLDNAARCLDLLDALPGGRHAPTVKTPVSKPAADKPEKPGREEAAGTPEGPVRADEAEQPEEPLAPSGEPPAAEPQRSEPTAATAAAVSASEAQRPDPELLALFIEEAKEEIGAIGRFLPIWIERPQDSEALISVRRSFHTLKGSGRMVGAQLVGEFSWRIENLLNRVINQTLEPTATMVGLLREAASALPELVAQLESGAEPKADVQALMKRAERCAEGLNDSSGGALAETAPQRASAASAQGVEASAQPSDAERSQQARHDDPRSLPEPSAIEAESEPPKRSVVIDPVLAEIFIDEMLGHVAAIRRFVEAAEGRPPPYPVEEALYRAGHTLLGSANMAKFEPAVRLARPLSTLLGRCLNDGIGLSAEGLQALRAAADEIARMADELGTDEESVPQTELIDLLERLAAQPGTDQSKGSRPSIPPQAAAIDRVPGATEGAREPAFDPEVAAIFAEEAAEILENAELALQRMRTDAPSSGGLVEMQRLLHTLKGGARMAGVTAMGDLSHALETLLSATASGRIQAAEAMLELVQRCLDRLHEMRDDVTAGRNVADDCAPLIKQLEAAAAGKPFTVSAIPAGGHTLVGDTARTSEQAPREAPSEASAAAPQRTRAADADLGVAAGGHPIIDADVPAKPAPQ